MTHISTCKVLTQWFSQLIPPYNSEVLCAFVKSDFKVEEWLWNYKKKTPLKFCKRYFRST